MLHKVELIWHCTNYWFYGDILFKVSTRSFTHLLDVAVNTDAPPPAGLEAVITDRSAVGGRRRMRGADTLRLLHPAFLRHPAVMGRNYDRYAG